MSHDRHTQTVRRRPRVCRLVPTLVAFGAALLLLGVLSLAGPSTLGSLFWTGPVHGDNGAGVLDDSAGGQDQGWSDVDDIGREDEPAGGPSQVPSPPSSPASIPLSLAGSFPSAGPGTFAFASSRGPVMGTAGTLRRFRVAVEEGAGEDLVAFAAKVDKSLGDPRGWTASGRLRLQRVPATEQSDFTIYLATAQTAGRMCARGGVDITVDGEPYTSCRLFGKVIINLARWRQSVPSYVSAMAPLDVYRTYVINHEVGHQLGHGHEACPGKGRPAPVMQQQTLGLDGCAANGWPYLNGERYTGPSV